MVYYHRPGLNDADTWDDAPIGPESIKAEELNLTTPFPIYYELGYPSGDELTTSVIVYAPKAKLIGGGARFADNNNRYVFDNPISYNQYQDTKMWVCLDPSDYTP